MVERIDMSLDDIIKMDGISRRGGRGGVARRGAVGGGGRMAAGNGGGNRPTANRGSGALRSRMNRGPRSVPYTRSSDMWQHDKFEGSARGGPGSSHILVSNLDFGVNDKDVRELFAEFGSIRRAGVHYDKSGRSHGTADVVFDNRAAALAAMKRYNGVLLDGRPMKITLVNTTTGNDNIQRRSNNNNNTGYRNQNQNQNRFGNNRAGGGRGRGRGGAGPQRNRTAGGPRRQNITAEELDADLDAYVGK